MSVTREEMVQRLGGSRRSFMKLLGASLALAGVEGCTRMPASNILPYVNQPELTPGLPQFYATSMVLDGYATGLLVESHEGRPTKVEGNPDHPASLGAAGVFEQASVLQLYDPHRARRVRRDNQTSSWSQLAAALRPDALRQQVGSTGAGLFLLLEPTSSPLESELIDRLLELYPAAHVHFYAPLATSGALVPLYDFREADVALAVDSDFLASGPFHLRYAREFAERRRPEAGAMNRFYAIESSVSVTGNAADHRLALAPSAIVPALEQLLAALQDRESTKWIGALAKDLRAHARRSVVVASPYLPERAQALALQINQALGNVGRTVWFTRSPLVGAGDARHSLASLVDALRAGEVRTLVCAGGNPGYATAASLGIGPLIKRVPQSVYVGLYENETARDCGWMVPAAHFLESWGDARAYDGTLSVVQPLVEPIFGARTVVELLSLLIGEPDVHPYDRLRDAWRTRGALAGGAGFDEGWKEVLRRGVLDGSAFPREQAAPEFASEERPAAGSGALDIVFRPHPRVHDGAFANNGWLQELPDPITTLTWDNAAEISPADAQRLDIDDGDLVELRAGQRSLRMPALVVRGHADAAVTVHFGYGRDGEEAVARGVGANVYALWPGDRFSISGARLSRVPGARRDLALTQFHRTLEVSTPVRALTLEQFQNLQPERRPKTLTLYQPTAPLPDGTAPHQWAMTIDLGACIGCGACMVACQAENNVPVVGREEVLRGREMHWLRIDWYAIGPPEGGHYRNSVVSKGASVVSGFSRTEPMAMAQPMLCQHCEKAPCEYACPVEATVHSSDGLNEMIYNRCVGTRFCSNNCPYKVRRFNWIDYNAGLSETEQLARNPDVTVRERGVMEKCTFCVQRIRQTEIAARVEHRSFAGSEVRTACQQACPTQAIAFGSLDDAQSPMVAARTTKRAYAVLDDLGTEPRVRYLARVRNANPDLEPSA